MQATYLVPEEWKSKCLESANVKWRTWKTRLYNTYILPNKDDHAKLYVPPADSGIHQNDWNQFVISRMSEDFKVIFLDHYISYYYHLYIINDASDNDLICILKKWSELQKERVRQHEYPHRMSRKGYANLAEEMKVSNFFYCLEVNNYD